MKLPTPPVPAKKTHKSQWHGITLEDDYAWLRDKDYPDPVENKDILKHLQAENDYYNAFMKPLASLRDKLFQEMKDRMKPEDSSVPAKDGPYLYTWSYEKGAEYRTWMRSNLDGTQKQVILDERERAKDTEFYALSGLSVCHDHEKVAWGEDRDGSERFTIRTRLINEDTVLEDETPDTIDAPVWSKDGKGYFYVRVNKEWRPFEVRYHLLGTPAEEDTLIYREKNPAFFVHISESSSRKWALIRTADHVTSEYHILLLDAPTTKPRLVRKRETGIDYSLDHGNDVFLMRVNDVHKNFRLLSIKDTAKEYSDLGKWTPLTKAEDTLYLSGFQPFKNFIALEERMEAQDRIRLLMPDGKEKIIPFSEDVYTVSIGNNPEFDQTHLRLHYESMVTPTTILDVDIATGQKTVRKVQEIPSGYDPSLYETRRLWAPARDGKKVPISLVWKKDAKRKGSMPLHLYGYGAYGLGMSPRFSTTRLSLLDRGFAYAIAHIRGGDEMGYGWYEGGKAMQRTNTFHDFIDCANFLINEGWGNKGGISISGGSAGGSLIGYVLNEAPDLWKAAVAHVPFVDVLNTILDESLPLTPLEWPEWGDPRHDKAVFEYMKSYSPYDNVKVQAYPPIMVTAGLNDPRVTYWEPAKWVAKLREKKTNNEPIILKTNMGAGHRGKSGRFDSLHEVADEFAFILHAFGKAET